MRGKWNHTEPASTQPLPADNTTDHVMVQVREWHRATGEWRARGKLIHPEVAMEVAAWWQAPSNPALTAFASSGIVLRVSLPTEIEGELTRVIAAPVVWPVRSQERKR